MAGRMAINTGKGAATKVPTPPSSASFVLGSRPSSLRATPTRIKPMASERQYGKADPMASSGFGQTGLTSRS